MTIFGIEDKRKNRPKGRKKREKSIKKIIKQSEVKI